MHLATRGQAAALPDSVASAADTCASRKEEERHMADINVERKGPSIWPWIVGLLVLALLIWAIAEMVDRGGDEREVAVEEVEPQVSPPAVSAPAPQVEVSRFQDILPLGPEDRGQVVMLTGQVMGQPTAEGFWVRTADNDAIFVLSRRQVQAGQQVQVRGELAEAQPQQASERLEQTRIREEADFGSANVHMNMHVVETTSGADQPSAPTN